MGSIGLGKRGEERGVDTGDPPAGPFFTTPHGKAGLHPPQKDTPLFNALTYI